MPQISFEDHNRVNGLPLRFWNMIVEKTPQGPTKSRRISRPGLQNSRTVGDGPIRDTFKFKGFRITVSGEEVYNEDTLIGTVPRTGVVRHATSDDECVIVANHRAYYVTLTAVTLITDPDLPAVRDVMFMAGRFIYVHATNDGQYSWSVIGDGTDIDGLAFASAESSPDPLLGGIILGDNILFFGSKTVEWHYPDSADTDAPFIRSRGRRYDKGCTSARSIVLADNNVYWVGNDRIIYRTGSVPGRVSDEDLENQLRQMSDTQMSRITAYRVIFSGHTFYVVNLPGFGTWALDVGYKQWTKWTTWMKDRFRADVCDDDNVMGCIYTNRLMTFDTGTYADMEDSIERIVSAYVPVAGGVERNTNVVLHCSRGVGLPTGYGSEPHVEMRYSDHEGADFTVWMEAPLGQIGDRSKAAMAHWTSLGSFQAPGRLYEWRCSDPVYFSCFSISYNEDRP